MRVSQWTNSVVRQAQAQGPTKSTVHISVARILTSRGLLLNRSSGGGGQESPSAGQRGRIMQRRVTELGSPVPVEVAEGLMMMMISQPVKDALGRGLVWNGRCQALCQAGYCYLG